MIEVVDIFKSSVSNLTATFLDFVQELKDLRVQIKQDIAILKNEIAIIRRNIAECPPLRTTSRTSVRTVQNELPEHDTTKSSSSSSESMPPHVCSGRSADQLACKMQTGINATITWMTTLRIRPNIDKTEGMFIPNSPPSQVLYLPL